MTQAATKTWDDVEILVVGAGTMGASIAQAYAQNGFTVGLLDISDEILARARGTIDAELDGARGRIFTDEEIDEIKKYFVDEMTEALTKGDDAYKIVTATGPGVARIRIDITELDETIGALNVTIYTKVTGLGLVVS